MKQFRVFLLFLVSFIAAGIISPTKPAYADNSCTDVKIYAKDNTGTFILSPNHFIDSTFDTIQYEITVNDPNAQYEVFGDDDTIYNPPWGRVRVNYHEVKNGPRLEGSINKSSNTLEFYQPYPNHRLTVKKLFIDPTTKSQSWQVVCDPASDSRLHFYIDPEPTPTPYYSCNLFGVSNNTANKNIITEKDDFWIMGNISPVPDVAALPNLDLTMKLYYVDNNSTSNLHPKIVSRTDPKSMYKQDLEVEVGKKLAGRYKVTFTIQPVTCSSEAGTGPVCTPSSIGSSCNLIFSICATDKPDCGFPTPTLLPSITPTPPAYCNDGFSCIDSVNGGPLCKLKTQTIDCSKCPFCQPTLARRPTPNLQIPQLKPLCEQLDPKFQDDCKSCVNSPKENPPGKGGIWSAIGCLPTDLSTLLSDYVFKTGVGIAGGIAFLSFLYGIFLIITSSGNAEKLEEAKQIIMSALSGLFLIIFSVFLLRVIGIDILQIPGFK